MHALSPTQASAGAYRKGTVLSRPCRSRLATRRRRNDLDREQEPNTTYITFPMIVCNMSEFPTGLSEAISYPPPPTSSHSNPHNHHPNEPPQPSRPARRIITRFSFSEENHARNPEVVLRQASPPHPSQMVITASGRVQVARSGVRLASPESRWGGEACGGRGG